MTTKQTKIKLTEGENFLYSAECKKNHSSPILNLSWCDLKNKDNLLKIHDMCCNSSCNCQKQIEFTPNLFQLERAEFENTMKTIPKVMIRLAIRF